MGYSYDNDDGDGMERPAGGDVIYRKKHIRLHNRILKMKHHKSKHTYFDSDGNEINEPNQVSEWRYTTMLSFRISSDSLAVCMMRWKISCFESALRASLTYICADDFFPLAAA